MWKTRKMDLCLSGNFKNKSIVAAASAFPGDRYVLEITDSSFIQSAREKGYAPLRLIRLEEYPPHLELLTEKCDTGQDFLN
jgi:hypothetical protein